MNSSDLSFVIQGPLFRTSGAGDLALKCTNSIRKFFPDSEIILSTWQDQDAGGLPVDQIVRNEDPGGFEDLNGEKLNVNRQILSTRKGLEVATRRYAVKFRADFALAGTSFFAREPALVTPGNGSYFKRKIRLTNLFVQNPAKMPFLFHFSDLVQFGLREDLTSYWNIPLLRKDELLNLNPNYKPPLGAYPGSRVRMRPEQVIPMSFLKSKGIHLDTENANEMTFDRFQLAEKFLLKNFEIEEWQESELIFPERMMDAFLETVHTKKSLNAIESQPQNIRARYRQTIIRQKFLFIVDRVYLFHLKKSLVHAFPFLQPLFSFLKSFQKFFFSKGLNASESGRAVLANLKKGDE